MNPVDKVWTVADVMVEDVVTVNATTPYRQLVELLWTYGISGLPVVGPEGRVVGMVSEADLLRHEEQPVAATRPPLTRTTEAAAPSAGSLMTAPVVTIGPEAPLTDAVRVMRGRNLKRLPVVDADGSLVGIISRADLLKVFLRSEETLEWDVADVLKRCLVPAGDVRVTTSDGVVRMAGTVETEEQARRVEAAVAKLSGVVSVQSDLAWPIVAASPTSGGATG